MNNNNMDSGLQLLGVPAHTFKMVGSDEAHGVCPMCGGKDRFVVHAIRPWPSWLVMCRVCMPEWKWADEYNQELKRAYSDEQRAAYILERQQYDKDRAEKARIRLAEFSASELWSELHRRMTDSNRQWWRTRGIPDDWQDYLMLGYMADKRLADGYSTPAYTIPYLRKNEHPITLQFRLVNPPNPADKYRFEYGLPAAWYETEPDRGLQDEIVICEGAIKAIVTRIYGGIKTNVSILAVPSKNAWGGLVESAKHCGRVWIILDPDGESYAYKLAREIGKARVIAIPRKIDDALMGGMTPAELGGYFRRARKI